LLIQFQPSVNIFLAFFAYLERKLVVGPTTNPQQVEEGGLWA